MFGISDRKNFTIQTVAKVIGSELPKCIDGNRKCHRVLTQSVYVEPGDVVISAGWYPHSQIIEEALEKGAAVIFCNQESKKKYPQENVIAVDDPKECVTRFQNWMAEHCHAKRIAITGSVGKTTTTGLINAVITNSFKTLTHHTMSNSHGAILRNVQRLEPSHEYWVQEVGGVQPGYVESTARFLRPDIVVLTNIGESHLNTYFTKQNIFYDKSSLERYAQPDGVVVVNYDDEILRNAEYTHRVVTCSKSDPRADYYAENVRTEKDGTHFTAVCKEGKCEIHLNLYGEHNVYNALFATAVGRLAGVALDKIPALLETYHPSGMRQNFVQVGGYSFFVDTFNGEPKTILGAAETLELIQMNGKGRKIFVTGHIDKLGDTSPELHTALGHDLAKLKLDLVLLYAGDSEYTYKAMLEDGCTNVIFTDDRDELDNWLRENVTHDDLVFFRSGQFKAGLAKTVDHVFGTSFQNEQQFNEGKLVTRDDYTFKLRQDNIAEIVGYTGKETELTIPAHYDDYTVIRIAPYAFTKMRNITSVVIPDTVTTIGQEAFYICRKLKTLHLPQNLLFIGKNAFNYCTSLETVDIPYGTIHVDRHAFFDCYSLKNVFVPETVGFFGDKVFGASFTSRKSCTIICKANSYAEQYAKENKLDVIAQAAFQGSAEKTAFKPKVKSAAGKTKTVAKQTRSLSANEKKIACQSKLLAGFLS